MAAGRALVELDISKCLALGEESCSSIARHCQRIEVIGLRNLTGITGRGLLAMFPDQRTKGLRCLTLSGSKNVSCQCALIKMLLCVTDSSGGVGRGQDLEV